MADTLTFVLVSIPTMMLLGLRHAIDVDHITAIDNLVRLHNATRKSRWIGTGFSLGHMVSVLAEMILIIYFMGSIASTQYLPFWGSMIGALGLGFVGALNLYSLKKWGKTGTAILATRILSSMGIMNPFSSALITGIVFGLGFDTATQISAIVLSAVASAALGVQVALVLAGFFALGMIPIDTLESFILRSTFCRLFNTKGFRFMSYSLSGAALAVAVLASIETITNSKILPDMTGPVLAMLIILASFGYVYATRKKQAVILRNVDLASQFTDKHRNDLEDEP